MALLTEEKQQLAVRISRGVDVLCSSIAQLHLSSPDPNLTEDEDETGIVTALRKHGARKWKFTNIEGALLLTRDKEKLMHFRIYDLQRFKLRFQYELYHNLEYTAMSDQFHVFEMDNCMCGFNFSSRQVAAKFLAKVLDNKPRNLVINQNPNLNGGSRKMPRVPRQNTNRNVKKSQEEMFLGNGMLDPNNVPQEWKKILKQAGIKKNDLKDPKMFQIVKDALKMHNIDLTPPTSLNFDDPRLQQYYTADQIEQWRQYQEQLEQYKRDQERYEREMAEYEQQQEQEAQEAMLQQAVQQERTRQASFKPPTPSRPNANKTVTSQSAAALPPKAPPRVPKKKNQKQKESVALPRMSVARPLMPALPVIPDEQRIAKIVNSRASKVVMKTNVLAGIKDGINLKRVSVLPDIKNKSTGEQNGIMETLRQKLLETRKDIANDDDDVNDSGSEWAEED